MIVTTSTARTNLSSEARGKTNNALIRDKSFGLCVLARGERQLGNYTPDSLHFAKAKGLDVLLLYLGKFIVEDSLDETPSRQIEVALGVEPVAGSLNTYRRIRLARSGTVEGTQGLETLFSKQQAELVFLI